VDRSFGFEQTFGLTEPNRRSQVLKVCMTTYTPAFTEILADLASLPDWEQRYEYIIDLGRALPPMPVALQTEAARVRGCTAQVWLVASTTPGGTLALQLASDALIVQGLLGVVHAAYAGLPLAEAAQLHMLDALAAAGLMQHLSPNRRNGLASVVERVRSYAASAAAA
jgi:cysteine desulfuration protein SufE